MEGAEKTSAPVDTRITLEKVTVNVGILSTLRIWPRTWDRKIELKLNRNFDTARFWWYPFRVTASVTNDQCYRGARRNVRRKGSSAHKAQGARRGDRLTSMRHIFFSFCMDALWMYSFLCMDVFWISSLYGCICILFFVLMYYGCIQCDTYFSEAHDYGCILFFFFFQDIEKCKLKMH